MTRLALIVVLGLLGTAPAFGQEPEQQTVSINDLSAPITPAFVLLDLAPASVDKPDNPKSFVVNAVNKITSANGGFPKDVAMQITPYWMKSHGRLTLSEYQNPGRWQAMAQSFSVSVATSPIAGATKDADPLGTHLALGFSVRPWNGRPNPKMAEKLTALEVIVDEPLNFVRDNPTATKAQIQKVLDDVGPKITAAAKQISELNAQRVGFFLTVAGGQVWDFVGDDTQSGAAKRTGAWVTAAYRTTVCPGTSGAAETPQCKATIDGIGVARYLHERDSDSMYDVGGRFVWNPTSDFSASVEMLRRFAPEVSATESTDNSNRTAGILEYRINDDLSVFGTFGQDFKKATGVKPLISLIGINIGAGKKPEAKTPSANKK